MYFRIKLQKKLSQGIEDFYNIDVPNNGTIERLLELSDKAGVNKVVIHSPATTPHQVQSVNNFIYDCTQNIPTEL